MRTSPPCKTRTNQRASATRCDRDETASTGREARSRLQQRYEQQRGGGEKPIRGVNRAAFGQTRDGRAIEMYTLTNANGLGGSPSWVELTRRLHKPGIIPDTKQGRALVQRIMAQAPRAR